jgi:hypothetical protein
MKNTVNLLLGLAVTLLMIFVAGMVGHVYYEVFMCGWRML